MHNEATRERAKNPKKERFRESCADLHDYVLFMANTGLRPDEAGRLEYRDVTIVTDQDTGERLLEIEVRGKRGVGYCKSIPSAVHTFQRLMEGANIYQVAKNCRTSVEMIEKFYAVHLKNTLDASAINVRKPRKPKK